MEVISLNSTNYIGLSTNYSPDPTLLFNQNIYYTEQGIDLPLSEALVGTNDSATNNYSNLFLTQSQPLTGAVYIQDLQPINDDGFTTYLAAFAVGGMTSSTQFMTVQETGLSGTSGNLAAISLSGTYVNLDNTYMFTIKFYTNTLCKVEHISNSVVRYLTVGYDGSMFFTNDLGTDYLADQSPQLFNYTYDRTDNYIVFSKNFQDIPWYLTCNGTNLTLTSPTTGIPYSLSAIFATVSRPDEPNNTLLYDPWVSYERNSLTNTQDINSNRSTSNVNSNLLLNSQYSGITGTSLDVNILSLKNTNTPENYQSRNNPFQGNKSAYLTEDDNEFRDYKKLFTGSNQVLGNDNVTLGYEAYTTGIVLEKDKVTYFHVPYSVYPFVQININDSGLIEAGAIAGDHPVKSDKIFKKLANAKYTSPFGSSTDETNGSFLCSWLSGSSDINTMPIWVDRYYNPAKTTFINALTSSSLKAITYSTVFDGFVQAAGTTSNTDEVFDVPSDLVFESGCYYAYHHYGPSDVYNYIQIFSPFLVDKDFPTYIYPQGNNVLVDALTASEYPFNNGQYAITSSLTGIQNTNQFTLAFDMYNQDWTTPFGYQILGNFVNDGFGIFNQNIVTPTIFVNSISSLDILNTDFSKLKTVTYNAIPLRYIRTRFGNNYSVIFNDGTLKQYTCDDRLLNQTSSPYLSSVTSVTHNDTTAFILCSSGSTTTVLSANIIANSVSTISNQSLSTFAFYANNINLSAANTITIYLTGLYFTPGTIARATNNNLYYLTDKGTSIVKWSKFNTTTSVTTAFKANTGSYFTDFNIDYNQNIWIINNKGTYYKYTQNNQFLLSGALTSNTPVTTNISITGNSKTSIFPISANLANSVNGLTVTLNNQILRPTFDYSLSGNNLVFVNAPLSGYYGVISYSQNNDTYTNNKINFVSEFANNTYYTNTLIARTGIGYAQANTQTAIVSSQAYQFVTVDTYGNQLSSTFYLANTSNNLSLTNSTYLREYVQGVYPTNSLNVRSTTVNTLCSSDLNTNEIVYNLSALDPGWHHFAVRFDAYRGFMMLFVDSQPASSIQFTPRKYKYSNLIYRPFLVGSACFNNSTPLFKYLQKISYLTENISIRNFYIYNTPLNDYDIIMHARQSRDIHDIHFDAACGRRNYLEEIERYFKANLPGSKSTQYNVVIRNTGITDSGLRAAIEARINTVLANSAPVYSKLNTIKWVN